MLASWLGGCSSGIHLPVVQWPQIATVFTLPLREHSAYEVDIQGLNQKQSEFSAAFTV